MKKIFILSCLVLFASPFLKAQDDCIEFFPPNEGAQLINKTFDAEDNLLNTITYTVLKSTENYLSGEEIQIGFTLADAEDKIISQGNIDARCDNGNFYLKMINKSITPEIMSVLGRNTKLIGDFLDYPNIFQNQLFSSDDFKIDEGAFTIYSKNNKDNWMRVRILNREYENDEKITTPAGTFNAYKITFEFETYKDKKTTRYSGVEWYAERAGIIRSETYDSNKKLINYTVLTTLKEK